MEKWKDILEFEGKYQVSDFGYVRRSSDLKIMGQAPSNRGYMNVKFSYNGVKGINRTAHRLVAEAFIPNPDGKPQVNHKDSDKKNNHVSNLEWVTQSENLQHAARNGVDTKLNVDDVRKIRELLAEGKSNQQIANRYGLCRGSIQDIRSGRNWGWLDQETNNAA